MSYKYLFNQWRMQLFFTENESNSGIKWYLYCLFSSFSFLMVWRINKTLHCYFCCWETHPVLTVNSLPLSSHTCNTKCKIEVWWFLPWTNELIFLFSYSSIFYYLIQIQLSMHIFHHFSVITAVCPTPFIFSSPDERLIEVSQNSQEHGLYFSSFIGCVRPCLCFCLWTLTLTVTHRKVLPICPSCLLLFLQHCRILFPGTLNQWKW